MNPIPSWTQRLWNAWDIRFLILCSLILQLTLVILGSRRRYIRGIWIGIIVWSSYLMADWVAAIAVGKLSNSATDSNSATETESNNGKTDNITDKALTALWAPLLLLHLGGPDTITAYSIEDTQLWLRHLFGLLAQAVLTIYVILCSWNNSALSFLTLPMFIAGTIKYGERTWVLWSANNEDQQGLKSIEDYAAALDLIRDIPGVKLIVVGYFWLQALTPYLANYGGNFKESERVAHISAELDKDAEVFELIEYVLGFMYDVLYTKTAMIHTRLGFILRTITFTCVVAVLVGFSASAKNEYAPVNVVITYILLSVAVALEFYAAALTIYSDWGILQMIKYCRKPFVSKLVRTLAPRSKKWKRWSNSVTQFNLIRFLHYEEKPKMLYAKILYAILKLLRIDDTFKKYWHQSNVYDLKEFEESANEKPKMLYRIVKLFKKNQPSKVYDLGNLKKLILEGVETINERLWEFENFTHRGELALERNQCNLLWSISKDFDQSIIAWHIATDICYNLDDGSSLDDYTKSRRENAKLLSDYMMHLLVNHPYMLRVKGGNVMIENTCNHLKETFNEDSSELTTRFWDKLKENDKYDDEQAAIVGWPAPRSPLVLARIVARELRTHEKRKWNILSSVWVEMLCHGAGQCQVNYQAKQLTGGGELLTHVWLLLTIYGFTEKVNESGPILRKIFTEKSIASTQGKGGY
ncbi:hypothetical protein LguiB_025929 [Lonicera macranthoides]